MKYFAQEIVAEEGQVEPHVDFGPILQAAILQYKMWQRFPLPPYMVDEMRVSITLTATVDHGMLVIESDHPNFHREKKWLGKEQEKVTDQFLQDDLDDPYQESDANIQADLSDLELDMMAQSLWEENLRDLSAHFGPNWDGLNRAHDQS